MDKDRNTPTAIEQLRKERFTKKEQILDWIAAAKARIGEKSITDKKHSAAFYHAYQNLLGRFAEAVSSAVLFEHLEDRWFYELSISHRGANLMLVHANECWVGNAGIVQVTTDQAYTLINVRGKYLSVEKYAEAYDVSVGTVRQWIRRGKIRTAIKTGNEWRIPEMTDISGRGYQSAVYMWYTRLNDLPPEYSFLNDYSTVLINQNGSNKSQFYVTFAATGVEEKTEIYESKDREKLELLLIAHPSVVNIGLPEDGLNVSISRIGDIGYD